MSDVITNDDDLKQYYAISEVAQMLDLPIATVRNWEIEFEVLKPKKNKKGDRFFTKKDIENLKVIQHLIKEKGYTLEGAKRKMQLNPDEESSRVKSIESLKQIKSLLLSLKESLSEKKS